MSESHILFVSLWFVFFFFFFQLQQSSHGELLRVLKILDQALEPRTFLVGESVSLADIAVVTAVLLPFKYVSLCAKTVCVFALKCFEDGEEVVYESFLSGKHILCVFCQFARNQKFRGKRIRILLM